MTTDNVTPITTKKRNLLSLTEIESVQDTVYEDVEAWGGTVRLGSLNAADLISFLQENKSEAGQRNANIRILIQSLVDDEGNRIGKYPDHMSLFQKKSAKTVNDIASRIIALNGLTSFRYDIAGRVERVQTQEDLDMVVKDLHGLADALAEAGPDNKALNKALEKHSDASKARSDAKKA